MGLLDWLGKLLGLDDNHRSDEDTQGRAESGGASEEHGATPAIAGTGASDVDGPEDPWVVLKAMPVGVAVARVLDWLEAEPDGPRASALRAWLRTAAQDSSLPADTCVRLSDFFIARGEWEVIEPSLRRMAQRGDALALPALVRLMELARQRGDVSEMSELQAEILAIDIDCPGVRERYMRMRAPVRTAGTGATLLAPDATGVAGGRLELVRELGRGGAGAVFLARDVRLGRSVALKIYHPAQRLDRGARLRTEAQVAAALASLHVIRVYDLFEELGAVAMEFCAGGALRDAMRRSEVPLHIRREWIRAVAHALAVTHDRGWVHRDVKPGNVLLRSDGVAVLTDFGLARKVGTSVEPHEGTPGFVPPEVRTCPRADPRHDVFAFGALARALVGENDPIVGPVVRAALSPDPEARPRDGVALLEALTAAGLKG